MEIEEPAANPADDVVTLADPTRDTTEQQEANTPAGGESDDLDALAKEALGESDGANLEFVEVEIDGKTYKVTTADGQPVDPELKFGALRDADYRKKTMSLSEERKAFQQEREFYQARANLQGDAAMRATNLAAIDAQIRQASSISIDALRQQGWTEEAIQQAGDELQALVRQREALGGQVQADIQAFRQMESQAFQKARDDVRQKAALADKALTPERLDYLEQFAIKSGVDEQDARTIGDPTIYKILHLADVGQKFLERQGRAATMKAAATGGPAKTLGGVNAGGKSPDQMDPAEMAKHLGY